MIIDSVKEYLNDGTMRGNPLGGNIQFQKGKICLNNNCLGRHRSH